MPDEMLCGKDGSIGECFVDNVKHYLLHKHDIDLHRYFPLSIIDLTDLLKDEIKGPATFKCADGDCAFSGMSQYSISYRLTAALI